MTAQSTIVRHVTGSGPEVEPGGPSGIAAGEISPPAGSGLGDVPRASGTSVGILKKIEQFAIVGSHIPPRNLLRYGLRKVRTRGVCRNFARYLNPADDALFDAIVRNVASADFLAAARRQRDLTRSMFAFDPDGPTLTFLRTRDAVDLDGIRAMPWRVRGAIPASDVNRAYFISFVDQAPLAFDRDPGEGLAHLARTVGQLRESAQPTERYLTIPWQPLPAARRMVNLLIGLAFALESAPDLARTAFARTLVDEIAACARITDALREDDLGYNHLATAMFGQCFYAAASGDDALLVGRSGEFLRAMHRQVGRDGMQLERSCTYQAHMLGHVDVLLAGNMFSGKDIAAATQLADDMRGAQRLLTHYDGGFAIFNDSAEGDGPSSASLNALPDERVRGLSRLGEAGYIRLDDGRSTIIFDAGKCAPDDTPGHAHADFLSIELDVDGQRFFVDPGTATYKAGPERDWTRSSHSHNGPTFEGLEPIEFFGAFRVARRGTAFEVPSPLEAPLTVAGRQTGFERSGLRVARAVGLWPEQGALLLDVWRGTSVPQVRSTFIVPAEWSIEMTDPGRYAFALGERRVVVSVVNATIRHAPGQYYAYGPRLRQKAHDIIVEADPNILQQPRFMAIEVSWFSGGMPFVDTAAAAERLQQCLVTSARRSD